MIGTHSLISASRYKRRRTRKRRLKCDTAILLAYTAARSSTLTVKRRARFCPLRVGPTTSRMRIEGWQAPAHRRYQKCGRAVRISYYQTCVQLPLSGAYLPVAAASSFGEPSRVARLHEATVNGCETNKEVWLPTARVEHLPRAGTADQFGRGRVAFHRRCIFFCTRVGAERERAGGHRRRGDSS